MSGAPVYIFIKNAKMILDGIGGIVHINDENAILTSGKLNYSNLLPRV